MAANNSNISNSNHLIPSSDQVNNKPIDYGQNVVQKVVTVSGKQVILTSSNSKSVTNSFKKSTVNTILNDQQKTSSTIESTNIKGPPKQVVSILPTGSLSPSRGISLSTGHSVLRTEPTCTSPVKVITVNASKSPHKTMPGSGTILNLGGKKITLNTESFGGGDGKQPYTLSPQKLYVKGSQSVNVFGSQKITSSNHTNSNSVQPISVSGSKFQYVRLVSTSQGQTVGANSKMANIAPSPVGIQRSIAPAVTLAASTTASSKVPIMPVQQANKSSQPSQQRLILPATTQVSIRPNLSGGQQQYRSSMNSIPGGAQALTQLPPGTTIISSGQNLQGVQGFALVPAQYVQQLQQTFTPQQTIQPAQQQLQSSYSSKELYDRPPSVHSQRNSMSGDMSSSQATRARKPCNCTKSQCLKLYCECFANGEFCNGCNCANCYNNLEHEEDRTRAIKQCLDRNPHAFRPKIGTGKDRNTTGNRRHNKGCNCKRSGCLKNYCECYEAKILCSHLCKCVGCKNFEDSPEKKTLMHLADAAEVRVQQQTAAKSKLSSQIEDLPTRPPHAASGLRLAFSFVTTDVADATCTCLIAQGEEAERTKQIDIVEERLILEEFGRCLQQVIESSSLS